MTIHPELLAVMQTAQYMAYTGQDGAGNNTYGGPSPVKVRMEGPTQSMRTSSSEADPTSPTEQRNVVLLADYVGDGMQHKGRILAPDGITYRIEEVKTHYDENGPYYQELTCTTNIER